jgi:NADH-quinone oxidoreductase subunit N
VLALIGGVASAIAAFFYVRVFVLMYFTEPTGSSTVVALPGWSTSVAIAVCATVTIVLGVAPAVLLDPAAGASVFLR